ncbi:hypothetical protein [Fibrella forsythiae]|uniref:Uncharacterized protein n=1 Tax=Fibrella forsythiae TaxID=2817061 RepID=A0ABS3JK64_9BACT|nr:hypothetical protein [Fibrella forsythiae]MBO0950385.1 hypothetical protein [Fibrella forsythiae]
MDNNARILKPEVLLRFVCYTSLDPKEAIHIKPDIWANRESALGGDYRYGAEFRVTSLYDPAYSGHYVVVSPPAVRQIPHPKDDTRTVPLVTVYVARKEIWPQLEPLAINGLGKSILSLN